ncbi:class A beta-lactamase [Streptomyces sp. AM 2-1-1]|uniref:class A beta-lactamase n=1 Tax=Streptomyces sp. AM 2-1-1 TaxID=3028709 RepID=UPI0023B8F1D3|nr:class A beta-lactamase [Streptomyces sp. AM 2-1-1]WEH41900.1 class A beta-lactamase [Streptomyces sp. AM 2-1-1]
MTLRTERRKALLVPQRPSTPSLSRRGLLGLAGAATAGTLLTARPAHAAGATALPGRAPDAAGAALTALEREHGARVGAYARNLATGRTVAHRAGERFPLCSTFKTLAAAAVLRDLDRDGEVLGRLIRYTEADLVTASDVTRAHLATGMTVAELCEAAICDSDNTAGNLLLRELGGPAAVTRFCRSVGDHRTRLDRWEPELNSAEPWLRRDTTTPYALSRTYAGLVLGDVLAPHDRERLTGWLLNCRTSGTRFRTGLPAGWTIADKTGGGSYGTCNDTGIAWTASGEPVVVTVLTTKPEATAVGDHPLVAKAAGVLAAAVG